MSRSPIVIIGGKGKTGARVDQRLRRKGLTTRCVSRSTRPAFDWARRDTWQRALAGACAAYVTYQPDLAVPGATADMEALVRVARDCGIEHLVLLSGRGEDGALRAEDVIRTSGINWTVVRTSWFAQNFSESFMLDGILAGELVLPASDIAEPFIDVDDIADVVVAALSDTDLSDTDLSGTSLSGRRLHNRLVEVTGPEALTFAQCIKTLSDAIGRDVRLKSVSMDEYDETLRQQGVDASMRWLLRELFTVVFDGRNTPVTNGVSEALGRPATAFSSVVERTVATGVWRDLREAG